MRQEINFYEVNIIYEFFMSILLLIQIIAHGNKITQPNPKIVMNKSIILKFYHNFTHFVMLLSYKDIFFKKRG